MRFWKPVLFVLFLCFVFFASFSKAFADENFDIDDSVLFRLEANGVAYITHNIVLTNKTSNFYATNYALTLFGIDPKNISASEGGSSLPTAIAKGDGVTKVELSFNDSVVGKDKERSFAIVYEDTSFLAKTGEVWEVTIPQLSENSPFSSYNLTLSVPTSFGHEAYVSPKPQRKTSETGRYLYYFDKGILIKSPIVAAFGSFQVFNFTLNYHLENPLEEMAKTEVAIPPDTAFQKVYYTKVEPKPANVRVDEDGNWLATFLLPAAEKVNVEVSGSVQIFPDPARNEPMSQHYLAENLKETQYWQVNDPDIIKLSSKLNTPEAIYKYVANTLSYDYAKVSPNVKRLGASAALKNPSSAICMEYTDLFVAIARAKGIPAREVNGYAYSENPKIEPLSLVADVLHAWPEYYDAQKGLWIPVDPTWASTSGGVDYFTKLDLRHFAFVIHGLDPNTPYPPGSYKLAEAPQKDVFVETGRLPADKEPQVEVTILPPEPFSWFTNKYAFEIKNTGSSSFYDLSAVLLEDGAEKQVKKVDILPPFSSFMISQTYPISFLGVGTPQNATLLVLGKRYDVPSPRYQVLLLNFVIILIVLSAVILAALIRLGIFANVKDKIAPKNNETS